MNEDKNIISILTDTLAEVSARAMAAEAELKKLKEDDSNWYTHWQRKDAEAKELSNKLAIEIGEHQQTRAALQEALKTSKEARKEQDNE
jgi:hypothetical protein